MQEKRGRKSAASLGVVTTLPERPRPPACLHDEEAEIWNQVVGAHLGSWLGRDAIPLLVQYCRHVVRADRIAQSIHNYEMKDKSDEGFDLDRWKTLLAIQEKESRAITSLARALRITHQAKYRADSADARPTPTNPPWECEPRGKDT